MRFLVISDTHGAIRDAAFIIEKWHTHIDGVWHLGDHASDLDKLAKHYAQSFSLAFSSVRGNCDFSCPAPYSRQFTIEDCHVFMCHGHQYRINFSLDYLREQAREQKADVVLFGHTHVPLYEKENGLLLLNPGSLTQPRGGSKKSFALLELSGGKADATILDADAFL